MLISILTVYHGRNCNDRVHFKKFNSENIQMRMNRIICFCKRIKTYHFTSIQNMQINRFSVMKLVFLLDFLYISK